MEDVVKKDEVPEIPDSLNIHQQQASDTLDNSNVVSDLPDMTANDAANTDESGWSDLDSEDSGTVEDANSNGPDESFEEFARKHSAHKEIFRSKGCSSLSAAIPRSVSLFRRRSPTSPRRAFFFPSKPGPHGDDSEAQDQCKSAPHSPRASPKRVVGPQVPKSPIKDAVVRSRSLENYRDQTNLTKSPSTKMHWSKRFFTPPSIVLTQPSEHSHGVADTKSDSALTSDAKSHSFEISLSRFLKPASGQAAKRHHSAKGHVTAEAEFQWRNMASNNNTDGRNNTDNRSSTPAAGVLLSEAPIQPSAAPVLMSGAENGNQSLNVTQYDTVDGSPSGEQQRNRNSVELDHIQQKILKISEAIKLEQATRDSNVADYLKLTTNADKQQTVRIKTVFEKKNQKSNATITQLQKKLETYHRRLRELESNGGGRQGRLRDVGANLRDFSGGVVDSVKQVKQATQNAAGAIVSKPKGLATKLKNKFGSVDNLNSLPYEDSNDEFGVSNDEVSSTSGSIDFPGTSAYDELPNQHSSVHSGPESPENGIQGQKSQTQQLHALAEQLMTLQSELEAIQRSRSQFESSWDLWKNQANDEITFLTDALREERHRYERLEVQLNDLTERHQHEVSSLKQDLTSMEEKVEYHARERERDMQEAIENCQTRLAKMELQQQQLVAVEGLENANARALLGKLINLLLSVLAVVLVFVSTISGLITPLMRSPARIFSTIVAIFALVITYKNWDNFVNWYMGSHR